MSTECRRWTILAGVVMAYFIIFPSDLAAILAPIKELLSLSHTVAPTLYILLASGVIAWALVRCFGRARDVAGR